MERIKKHVAMFSTGVSSAYLAHWLIEHHGPENVDLLFTDTLWEDEDNYRFMKEVSVYLQKPITTLADGRDPEQVFFDSRFFGNFGTAPCSKELKMKQTVVYVEDMRLQGYEPILYFGIGGHERHRAPRIAYSYSHNCLEPVECQFPLMDLDVTHSKMDAVIEQEWGIAVPRMYLYGFEHANCGGRCVKGGIKHYRQLYLVWPDRFQAQEEMENRFRRKINDYTLLKKYVGKGSDGKDINRPYSLSELRMDIETNGIQEDLFTPNETPCACIF